MQTFNIMHAKKQLVVYGLQLVVTQWEEFQLVQFYEQI